MKPETQTPPRLTERQLTERLAVQHQQSIDALREASIVELSTAPHVSSRIISSFARLVDGLAIAILGLTLAYFYPATALFSWDAPYLPVIIAAAAALPLLASLFELYAIRALLQPVQHVTRLLACWTAVLGAITAAMFFAKLGNEYSRVWLSLWYLSGLVVLAAVHTGMAYLARYWNRNGQLDRRAVLVGGGERASALFDAIKASHNVDIKVVGVFDDRDDNRSPATLGSLAKLGTVTQLIDFVRRTRVDMLIVTIPMAAEERLLQIMQKLWVLPVDIRLSAYAQKMHFRPRAYSYIGNVPFMDVFDKPLGDWGVLIKAIEDRVVATLAIVLLAPVMAAVAVAVRLESKGPALFKQKRYGFNNELIEVYKFRSMYHQMSDADATKLVSKGDARVTKVGRFIRKTSLDELPQLFNVLKGDLSLVGPRPHATKAKAADQLYNDVVDGYFARHKVKPGITGWAQINGWRGETDTTEKLQRRVEHDLYYIENWSLAFDLAILIKTPYSLFKSESAY